jgi:hypothetical protein
LKQTTLDALLWVYVKLEEIIRELYNLADDAIDQGDYDDLAYSKLEQIYFMNRWKM